MQQGQVLEFQGSIVLNYFHDAAPWFVHIHFSDYFVFC
jgi:hypothetical protein